MRSVASKYGASGLVICLLISQAVESAHAQDEALQTVNRVGKGAAGAKAKPEALEPLPKDKKKKPISPVAAVNLINALVAKGSLTEEQGADLIKQAEDEAYVAREASKSAAEKADAAETVATKAAASVPEKGARRVAYVPDIVKNQIRDDVQASVFVRAEKEGWASPNALPEWTKRIRISGDVRTRYEGVIYPRGNCKEVSCNVDYNAINSGAAIETSFPNVSYPYFDVDQDRNRFRLRARLGVEANVADNFFVGTRIGTGESSSPVSLNQTLGASGGNFSKYQLWLDRAYIGYKQADGWAEGYVGRFDNPFFTTDLIWDPNLGFDGAAIRLSHELFGSGITAFANAGAFPIFNTAFNFSSNNVSKTPSEDRYLFGGQVGVKAPVNETSNITVGAAFFDFNNVADRADNLCNVVTARASGCPDDVFRPGFAQKGNTYRLLRNLFRSDGLALDSTPQYFGLRSQYDVLALNAKVDIGNFSPFHIVVEGEYVNNLAFDRKLLSDGGSSNNLRGEVRNAAGDLIKSGTFDGGGTGYLVKATFGQPKVENLWEWNVSVAYRYLESDATVDAFTYSDFGLGGTNLQGYIIGGKLGLGKNVFAEVKWLSADNISGGPYSVDVVQVDLNAKF